MQDIKIATVQFEPQSGNKTYNLKKIETLTAKAKEQGTHVISFHELSVTGYTFLKDLSYEELIVLAEEIPDGDSTRQLISISKKYQITILAGVLEKEGERLYNAYVCVDQNGLIAKFRKLHPFISKHLSAGNEYVTFDILGWKCSILICYDNNIVENVRAVTLSGTEILFAPHVTMCTPSPMPGRGFVDKKLWDNRHRDPAALRMEFDGLKGRSWLMRWLPARAYDNGIYLVFSNPIGMDGEQLKNGNALILDPFGEILSEIRSFEDEITTAVCISEKLKLAGGYRYREARRPELYKEIIGKPHQAHTKPVWIKE